MADQDDPDEKSVGYKKPPERSRWPKGKSGNPGGRPKKQALDSDDRLIALVEAQVPHSEHTVLDLLWKAAIKAGVQNGDIKAVRLIYENYLQAKRRRRSTTTDDAGDRAIVERLLGDHPLVRDIFDEAAEDATGEPAPPAGKPTTDG